MGRGRGRLALLLLGALLATSLAPSALADRVLVGDEHREDLPSVVHVVVEPPAGLQTDALEVIVTVDGPAGDRELTARQPINGDAGEQLVTLTWTPEHVGEHTLRAEAVVGDQVRVLGEEDVYVSSDPARASSSLPETAPGTVQWAIAFGFLFFVARAGFGQRTR